MLKFKDDILPPGIHEVDWGEFESFFSFSPVRKEQLKGLCQVVAILKECGCTAIYIDGSFVTTKLEPGDWDACFECPQPPDPCLIKLVSKYPLIDRKEQKKRYKGELFPAWVFADAAQTILYRDFFQQVRNTTLRKGIVKIKLQS